ncbi:xanthine dehydrogenase/oxidase-like [Gigantopelta aegis]|uniref:xanthine dehydrogenase/oxidase-like n=1 Tax=Gigantopelta aegis TaxID=1735272 RepID=UPI001B88B328|nr:xanthine dehydrogenase/oxidase-like [Gigantopelta aegis]
MEFSTPLVFFVNGQKIVENNADPNETLLQYVRNRLHLTGSKLGCGEGGCGACTVMVSSYGQHRDQIIHLSVNACLAPICSLHGMAVTTVEGIGSTKTRLHPVQEQLANAHGTQCGFCTPGIVMSMYTLLRNNPRPTQKEMESYFDGNLCRCTGYRPILQGFQSFTKDACPMGENCCMNKKDGSGQVTNNTDGMVNGVANGEADETSLLYDPSQEPIFPPELKVNAHLYNTSLKFSSSSNTWYRPISLDELLDLKKLHPSARLIVGNTELGIEKKFKNAEFPVLICTTHIEAMNEVQLDERGLVIGASVTLSRIQEAMQSAVDSLPEWKTRIFAAFLDMLQWFASHQIRNVAAIGGNIMTASPISDLIPLLMAAGAELYVMSKDSKPRYVKMDHTFLKGYRKTDLNPEEILISVKVPCSNEQEHFYGYKVANRKDDDIAIVSAGLDVQFQKGTDVIENISCAYGGMAPTTVMALKTMAALIGSHWDESMLTKACNQLEADLPLSPGAPGGMVEFRRTLTTSFFFKFFITVKTKLIEKGIITEILSPEKSVVSLGPRACTKGIQVFEEHTKESPVDIVGHPVAHNSAQQQTTGEAVYVDDMKKIEGELNIAFVLSTKARAKILSVDTSDALQMPGVKDYVCAKDVPGKNIFGVWPMADEEIFASNEVYCHGQIIGGIVADTKVHAQKAAKKVKVGYEEMKPIITIEEAIANNSFDGESRSMGRGDTEAGFAKSDHVIEGEVRVGAQEHFYLETITHRVIPQNEDGCVELYASTQAATDMQLQVARALGVNANRVVVKVKRIGGAFGGKEIRPVSTALPAAVAAVKLNSPIRTDLDRDEDMIITGTRNPFLAKYKVGFTSEGKIISLDVQMYLNSGKATDLSRSVMTRALSHCENAYNIPNIRATGCLCKTNISTNTAFRAFGGPQSYFIVETWITHVADFLGKPTKEIRELNMYKDSDMKFFKQPLEGSNLTRIWQEVQEKSNYESRKKTVDEFNRNSRWVKHGLSLIPVLYGIGYESEANFLNQGSALVHIYLDGSVLVTHGGVEMGQGLHIKMIQIASHVLKIPRDKVFINDTTTDKIPNTSPSAASSSSDIYGGAVKNACEILCKRLEPYMKSNPNGTWESWVGAAYMDCIQLSASGFYNRSLKWDKENGGKLFPYWVCGAAVTEVELDCLTGEHEVLRTDIVMDVGRSLNPAVDIGQIEGAFTQGYGLFCLEHYKINPDGILLTQGPSTYKIPSFRNVPVEMNVHLLKGSRNDEAVFSSKGIGEPPLFLGASVFFAIKDAISSARADEGITGYFRIDSPATPDKIRMACQDRFSKQFPSAQKGSYRPWFVDL